MTSQQTTLDEPLLLAEAVRALSQGAMPPQGSAKEQFALQVQGLTPDEARQVVSGVLLGPFVQDALEWLHEIGFFAVWLAELEATVNFSQEADRRHKDVWAHTKQVVDQSVPRMAVRWASLIHDVGKVPTRTYTADGGVHFHHHAEVGARMLDDISRRLNFEKPLRQTVRFLILHHLRANQYDGSWTDSAVRRFDREMQPYLEDLLDLSRADITSRRPGKRQAAFAMLAELANRIAKLREEDAILPLLPSGIGNLIMERFGLPPSRQIGEIKGFLEDAVNAGELEPRREAEYYLERVAQLLKGANL